MDMFEKLYIVRTLIALNQKEAAEKAGLNQATISTIERGERNSLPNAYLVFLYQNGVDLNWIFNNEKNAACAFRNDNNGQQRNDKQGGEERLSYGIEEHLNKVLNKLLDEMEKINTTLLLKL